MHLEYSSRPDLIDQASEHLDWEPFMDESSLTESGWICSLKQKAEYAVVTVVDN